ncbi:MAG: WYL domain-containing protein [Clostridia bacterium]|nr:WYL domain-containing protein [Clostridia bacterium]
MIFSELYSAYYNAVAGILTKAAEPGVTEKELQNQVIKKAFSESILTILPTLKSGRWPLLKDNLSPVLSHAPAMPLTLLQKRWLKSLTDDPRIRLFNISFPDLEDVKPLFTCEDYKIYDQYSDGDPYEDEEYIKHFRLILSAIKTERPVKVTMTNRYGKEITVRFFPKRFEYSLKDDKFRVIATGCKFHQFNLGRIKTCEYYTGNGPWNETPEAAQIKDLTLTITNRRNAMERAMLHFAHFEKTAEKIDEMHYILRLKYYADDETELVIRILSFGPHIKVEEPESFINLIKERLILQKKCEIK